MARRRTGGAELTAARTPAPAAVTVVLGDEEFLVDRAIEAVVHAARGREAAPAVGGPIGSVHDVSASDLAPGELAALTAPSLFGGTCVVVVRSAQDAVSAVAAELVACAADPRPDVLLVVTHAGGAKGAALLRSLTVDGAAVVECRRLIRFGDRLDFTRAELRRLGRAADEDGVRTLLEAVGPDLREIAAACAQLAADVEDRIDRTAVLRYYRGHAEVSGFAIADRVVEGQLGAALEQLRWALATGTSPVLLVSALAQALRLLGRVGSAPRGAASAALAGELGAPPWKIDRVRQQVPHWSPAGVADALRLVADADAQVKGETASPEYALERAIRRLVACRAG